MEKKSNSCPKDVCEKFYKAVTVSPFRGNSRTSHRPHEQHPRPPSPAPDSSSTPLSKKIQSHTNYPRKHSKSVPRNGAAAAVAADQTVPIHFDFSSQTISTGTPLASRIETEAKTSSTIGVIQSSNKGNHKANLNLPKVESPPQAANQAPLNKNMEAEAAGDNKKTVSLHIEDRFTEYINGVRNRMIRTFSNAGDHHHRHRHHEKQHAPTGKDKFTDFINRGKVKLRTTSSIGGGGKS